MNQVSIPHVLRFQSQPTFCHCFSIIPFRSPSTHVAGGGSMPPPLILQRCIAHGPLSRPFLATQIRHGSFTKQSIDKTVLVQLTKDVPRLGSRGVSPQKPGFRASIINEAIVGDVVSVRRGRMRNMLYPYSMAQYIHPGAETFLTKNKLAIPVGPNYRRLLRKTEPDPLRQEYRQLFEDVSPPSLD